MVHKLFDSLLDLPAEDLVRADLSELSQPCLPSNLRIYCPYALEAQVAVRTHELLAADRGWRTPWK